VLHMTEAGILLPPCQCIASACRSSKACSSAATSPPANY
jgi:hypothetical protein